MTEPGQAAKRSIAIGASREQLRKLGIDPSTADVIMAWRALDELSRKEPYLIASTWYVNADERQFALFSTEWRNRQQTRGHSKQH